METGETPSLGPSRCFACPILSFALCLANLYEGVITEMWRWRQRLYKPCLSFFISFSFSGLSHSFHRLSLSSLTSHSLHTWCMKRWIACPSYFIVLTIRTRNVRNHDKTWTACQLYFIVLTFRTRDVWDHNKIWMACQSYFIVLTVHTRDVRNYDRLQPVWSSLRLAPTIVYSQWEWWEFSQLFFE